MLRIPQRRTGGHSLCRIGAALQELRRRSSGGLARCNVSPRGSDTSSSSRHRVSGNFGGLVLRCVVGMLSIVLVTSGCGENGITQSVGGTVPTTTVAPTTPTTPPSTSAPATTSEATTRPTAPSTSAVSTTTMSADPTSTTTTTSSKVSTSTVPASTEATPTTLTPTTSSPPGSAPSANQNYASASVEQQIFATIVEYYDVWLAANNPPNPNSPLWDNVVGSKLAAQLSAEIQANLDAKRGVRWPEDRQAMVRLPWVLYGEGPVFIVNFCLFDNVVHYDLATNEVLDDSASYRSQQLTLSNASGRWRVIQDSFAQGTFDVDPVTDGYETLQACATAQ